MNAVFCIMIAAAFGYAAIGGNLDAVTHAAVQAGGDALQTVLGLLGGFMLFGGVMKLLEEAGTVRALVRWLKGRCAGCLGVRLARMRWARRH